MLFISHRGNLDGPIAERENSPDYIDAAIEAGFIVEIDASINDRQINLGCSPLFYPVEKKWLEDRAPYLLLHLKNQEAVLEISQDNRYHFFCNERDEFSLTSEAYVLYWSHNPKHDVINNRCIVPMFLPNPITSLVSAAEAGGIISDNIQSLRAYYGVYS